MEVFFGTLFCDDSIARGTQIRDKLIYNCPFINFASSKGDSGLITRKLIKEFEGDPNKNLEKYAITDSPEYYCRTFRVDISKIQYT